MAKVIENFDYEIKDKDGDIIHVSAKIEEDGGLFHWSVSHHTKPQDFDGTGVYWPSSTESRLTTAKSSIRSYIKMMQQSKVVIPNDNY